ncbi:uncharacterized protein LOC124341846 isoform X1 [Daphnia pulicaria]|uniref:uncharacterized protein LOC124341846 isoform X1 n=2 Tax=Daphnia pulicaria TaxID=35523 RepID=UPI001EEC8828|nr:uncharacterized protein LOC124341846 isoform X1 [Daphnia pulicaria]
MFFSSALSALQKHQEEEDDEEEDVFQHAREVVAAKTYSMETAVRYVYGQGFGMDVSVLTDEEKEAIERARYCRKQLLRLKARRAAQEAGEADNSQILQQEEVEEWLANIELRLRQQSHKLGISPAELPIWIAPHMRRDLKIGNIASAAKAAAAAIRLKLSGNEMTPNGSPSTGATPNATPRNDEKAAAIAALTDLMDELEELSLSSRENLKDKSPQPHGPKRTVRFQTPGTSPFQTPRSERGKVNSPVTDPGGLILFHRANRLKKTTSEESKVQQPHPSKAQSIHVQQPTEPRRPLKTKVSALASSEVTRPSSCPGRSSVVNGPSEPQQPAVKSKSSSKSYVSRRRGSDNSPLAQLYPT